MFVLIEHVLLSRSHVDRHYCFRLQRSAAWAQLIDPSKAQLRSGTCRNGFHSSSTSSVYVALLKVSVFSPKCWTRKVTSVLLHSNFLFIRQVSWIHLKINKFEASSNFVNLLNKIQIKKMSNKKFISHVI